MGFQWALVNTNGNIYTIKMANPKLKPCPIEVHQLLVPWQFIDDDSTTSHLHTLTFFEVGWQAVTSITKDLTWVFVDIFCKLLLGR